jgi:hypothetical protein
MPVMTKLCGAELHLRGALFLAPASPLNHRAVDSDAARFPLLKEMCDEKKYYEIVNVARFRVGDDYARRDAARFGQG